MCLHMHVQSMYMGVQPVCVYMRAMCLYIHVQSTHTCATSLYMCVMSVHVCVISVHGCAASVYTCVQCVCACAMYTHVQPVSHTHVQCVQPVSVHVCNASVHACAINIHTCAVSAHMCAVCAISICTHVYNLFHTKESMLTPLPHLMYWKLFHCSTRRASSLFEMGKWQPTPVLVPRKSHGWRSLVQATVHGVAKSRTRLGDFTKLTKYILLFDCPMFTEAAHGRGLDYRH